MSKRVTVWWDDIGCDARWRVAAFGMGGVVCLALIQAMAGCSNNRTASGYLDWASCAAVVRERDPYLARVLTHAHRAVEETGVPETAGCVIGRRSQRVMLVLFYLRAGYEEGAGVAGPPRPEELDVSKPVVICVGLEGDQLGIVGNAEPTIGISGQRRLDLIRRCDVLYALDLVVGEWGMDGARVSKLMEGCTSFPSTFEVESSTDDGTPVACLVAENNGETSACVVVGPRVLNIMPGEAEGVTGKWFLDVSELFFLTWQAVKKWPMLEE